MRLLTFNAGLLDLAVFGRSLVRPAGWIAERYAALAPSILALDPDIVTLQEVYTPAHKQGLAAALRHRLPHAAISPLRGRGLLPASLVTLSRWPLQDLGFHRFRRWPWSEGLVDNKGFLLTRVRSPHGTVRVANVHTTAGGLRHPEHPGTEAIRARQLEQLLAACASATGMADPPANSGAAGHDHAEAGTLLAGDFNCGSVSPANHRQLTAAGYVDLWPTLYPDDPGWTWEPTSVLNAGGAHAKWGCPAQRIDLLMQDPRAESRWRAARCQRVFTEATVGVDGGHRVTLSDHCGVLAELEPRDP